MDPTRPTRPTSPARDERVSPDDATIGAAIRVLADDWQMPLQRPGDVTWRERVGRRSTSFGRGAVARPIGVRWTRHFAAAASLAVVGTVSLAFAAVWLTTPHGPVSPGTATQRPSPSGATASPSAHGPNLPRLLLTGAAPSVTSVLLADGGAYRLADLSTGDLSASVLPLDATPVGVLARPGGGWVCVCPVWQHQGGSGPVTVRIDLIGVDATGHAIGTTTLRTLSTTFDPAFPAIDTPRSPDVSVTSSRDGTQAYVGWSAREPATPWQIGVDIVDLATLETVRAIGGSVATPDGIDGQEWTRSAPVVSTSPDGRLALLSSFWYVLSNSATPPSGTDHWIQPWGPGTQPGRLSLDPLDVAWASGPECVQESGAGFASNLEVFLVCRANDGNLEIHHRDALGRVIDTKESFGPPSGSEVSLSMQHVGNALYFWDPVGHGLTRYDLTTDTEVFSSVPGLSTVGGAGTDLLADLGRRLGQAIAPTVTAKVFLRPGFAISSDGSRVYALGIDGDGIARPAGSTGIDVFDGRTGAVLAQWDADADFTSVALSADDRFVYATGGARRDSAGQTTSDPASLTVYDPTNGQVRLVAGDLGVNDLWFPVTPLQ